MPPPFPRTAPLADVLNDPNPENFDERKTFYESSDGYTQPLRQINAAAAYARGATGKGEVVGVRDSKIARGHREFGVWNRFARGEHQALDVLSSKVTYAPNEINDQPRKHGTAVASLIAGKRTDSNDRMHGVAFDAEILAKNTIFNPFGLSEMFEICIHPLFRCNESADKALGEWLVGYAQEAGLAIVNHSFEPQVHFGIDKFDAEEVRKRLKHTAAAFAQKDTPDADKIIFVWGAGNSGPSSGMDLGIPPSTSPGLWAGLGAVFPELQSHVLAVVAVDQQGVIEDYSTPCGAAQNFCLAAPAEHSVAATFTCQRFGNIVFPGDVCKVSRRTFDSYDSFNGTSAAAPMVSGSLAVMRQFFKRQLGNTELVTRLLATANRTGDYADSDIYGHGLVDLDAATAPVGALNTSLSGDPLARPFTGGGFAQSGGAFGAAMQDGLAGVEIAAFDQLDAPFFFPVTGGAASRVSAAYDTNLREHEIALGGGVSQSASLSLMTDGGELSSARLRRGDWWFSYGHHGGREAGLYLSGGGGNGGNLGNVGGIGAGGFGAGGALIGGIGVGGIGTGGSIGIGGGIGNGGAGGGIGNIGMGGNVGGIGGGGIGNTGGGIGMGGGIGTGGTGNG
ncbi:MAG: S8 family serine peptidase, partial [Gammaproteobacteria bacterium]